MAVAVVVDVAVADVDGIVGLRLTGTQALRTPLNHSSNLAF